MWAGLFWAGGREKKKNPPPRLVSSPDRSTMRPREATLRLVHTTRCRPWPVPPRRGVGWAGGPACVWRMGGAFFFGQARAGRVGECWSTPVPVQENGGACRQLGPASKKRLVCAACLTLLSFERCFRGLARAFPPKADLWYVTQTLNARLLGARALARRLGNWCWGAAAHWLPRVAIARGRPRRVPLFQLVRAPVDTLTLLVVADAQMRHWTTRVCVCCMPMAGAAPRAPHKNPHLPTIPHTHAHRVLAAAPTIAN